MWKASKSCGAMPCLSRGGVQHFLLTRVDIAPCACDNVFPIFAPNVHSLVLCWRLFVGMRDVKKNYKRR
jgi:hypothetical protein